MSLDYSPKIVTNGLVLCLDASDPRSYPGSGTAWNDRSGLGNNTTLVNGVVYNSANGGSLVFDGVNDYCNSVTIPNPSNQLTVEVTMNYNSKGSYHNIFDRFLSTPMLWIRPDNKLELNTSGGLISNLTYVGQNIVATAVYRNTSPGLQLYINGVLVGQNNTASLLGPNPSTYTLFNRNTVSTFSGTIYNLRMYNRALSADEIKQNFEATRSRFGI